MKYIATWHMTCKAHFRDDQCPEWFEQIGYRCEKIENLPFGRYYYIILDHSLN